MRRKDNRRVRVLNELPENVSAVEEGLSTIGEPLWLEESAMTIRRRRAITETVQDKSGVKGDFMTNMGGRTERLGGKQKNTGHAYEFDRESTHGEASDGITSHHADLNLKTKQKNTGGGFQEFGDSKHGEASDGITSHRAEMNLKTKQKNTGGQFETFAGSKNTMGGSVSEQWSVGNIASLMEGSDIDLQALFEAYTRQTHTVCLEDFQQIIAAHGVQTILSEQNLEDLMRVSRKFVFYEGNDYQGRFWQPRPTNESVGSGDAGMGDENRSDPTEGRPQQAEVLGEEGEEGDDIPVDDEIPVDGGEIAEIPDMTGSGMPGDMPMGGEMGEIPGEGGMEADITNIGADMGEDDQLADVFQNIGDEFSRAASLMGGHDESAETPEDEAAEDEFEGGAEGEFDEIEDGVEDEIEDEIEGSGEEEEVDEGVDLGSAMPGQAEEPSTSGGDEMNSIGNAVTGKAKAAKAGRPATSDATEKDAADDEAMAGDPKDIKTESRRCRRCGYTTDAQGCAACALHESLEGGMKGEASGDEHGRLSQGKQSEKGELGSKIPPQGTLPSGKGGEARDGITKEIRSGDLGKGKTKNAGGSFEAMKENVIRLATVAKEAIETGARKIGRAGKYQLRFVVAMEGMTPIVQSVLAEALTDAEELVQVFGSKAVQMEARFYLPNQKKAICCQRIPIATIKRRDPIVSEGKVLFRTAIVANTFADRIVSEGAMCRVKNHNWGAAVSGGFDYDMARHAFRTLTESPWGTQVRSPAQERLASRAARPGSAYSRSLGMGPLDPRDEASTRDFTNGERQFNEPDTSDEVDGGEMTDVDGEIGGGYPGEEEQDFGGEGGGGPGPYDAEGMLCPNCGCTDVADQSGHCPECGDRRSGESPEAAFGGQEDPNAADSDEYLDQGGYESRGGSFSMGDDQMLDDERDPAAESRPEFGSKQGLSDPEERAPMPQRKRPQRPVGRPARI